MAQVLDSVPFWWHIALSPDSCAVADNQGNSYCTVAPGGFSIFFCTSKCVHLTSDGARLYPLTGELPAFVEKLLDAAAGGEGGTSLPASGEPMVALSSDALTMQHATWFDNSTQSAVTITPATWNNEVITCYLKTAVSVTLSGVQWLYGEPAMVEGFTYAIALQQIDASTVLANLAYTLKQ